MEIACGYSPRGMELSGAGIHYAGGDFSSVANSMKKLTENYVSADQKKNLDYCEMDCTDRKQMESAAAILEGPVCIVTEGLFMYLNAAQTAIFFDNIHAILQEKRGCFITQDFSTKNFVMDVAEAIYPGDGLKLFLQSVAMYVRAAGSITTRELKENSLKFERS